MALVQMQSVPLGAAQIVVVPWWRQLFLYLHTSAPLLDASFDVGKRVDRHRALTLSFQLDQGHEVVSRVSVVVVVVGSHPRLL